MTRWIGAWLGAALACVSNAGAAQDAPAEAGAKIAALARLSPGPGSPEAIALLQDGLKDTHLSVRAAAARVTHVIGVGPLLPELREALRTETDANAAYETAWAIADLDSSTSSDAALVAALESEGLRDAVLRGLFAGRGPRAAALWPSLKSALAGVPGALAGGLERGVYQDSGSVFASLALRDGLEDVYTSLLSAREIEVDASVVTAGTQSSSSRIRVASYLTLANRGAPLVGEASAVKPTESLEERVALHLFEAFRGGPKTDSLQDLLTALVADPLTHARVKNAYLSGRSTIRGLDAEEREKLLRALGVEAREIESARARKFPLATTKRTSVPMRTFRGHPPDFARSVFAATGCKGRASAFDGVEVAYRPGGRAAKVAILPTASSANGCADAARILGVNTLAFGGDEKALLILPQRPEFLACLGSVRDYAPRLPKPAPATQVGGGIKEPVKTRNVPPVYPQSAKEGRVQGIVVVEATITESGCVSGLQVLYSQAPALDLAAIDAVSAWGYTPTLVNGTPVPVIMTVTVNFRLN